MTLKRFIWRWFGRYLHQSDLIVRRVFTACQLFCLLSVFVALDQESGENVVLCFGVMMLMCLPFVIEQRHRFLLPTVMLVALLIMSILGPILGKIYCCYYKIVFWDKMMHTMTGFTFAAIGFSIPAVFDGENKLHSLALKRLSGLTFSLSIAVIWEFFEYLMDVLWGTDMQADTVVPTINSYLLGGNTGTLKTFENITAVTVDGNGLGVSGFLDIGINDTMQDMMMCTMGAIAFCLIATISYNKHPKVFEILTPQRKYKRAETEEI